MATSDLKDLKDYSFPSLGLKTNDGNIQAYNLVADLVLPLSDLNLETSEGFCRNALDSLSATSPQSSPNPLNNPNLVKYQARNKPGGHKKGEKDGGKKGSSHATDLFAKLNSYTINQQKNQAIRFGLDNGSHDSLNSQNGTSASGNTPTKTTAPSGGGSFFAFSRSSTNLGIAASSSTLTDSKEYEDVLSMEILQAPICDLCIILGGETVPDGFFRLYKTTSNKKANLNSGSGGNGIYLCIKKDLTGQLAPITNLIVLFPDRNETIPPGYHCVHRGDTACNLNTGSGAERIYLCYKKDFLANPITDMQIIFPSKGEAPPKSFQLIDKSISGFSANLNSGTGGLEIFLTYRQDLVRIACLLNESDAEVEKLKRRYTRTTEEMHPHSNSGSGRRGSIADVILSTRSRSRSPVPRRPTNSIDISTKSDMALKAQSSLAAEDSIHQNDVFNNSDIADALTKAVKFSEDHHVVIPESKTDEVTELLFENDAGEEWPELPEEMLNPKEMEQATLRKTQEVVDANGERIPIELRKALLAILSAVYVRHGSIWDVAMSGLVKLFKDTNFFEKDMAALPLPATVTMLDLTIESVCDRFDLSPESDHNKILEFLRIIIRHSGARLAPFSLQRMFKAISYVCNIQATKPNWIQSGQYMPCNDPNSEITPFRVLKQLVCDTAAQVENAEVAHFLPDSEYFETSFDFDNCSQDYIDIRIIVEDLIDDVIDSVEVSRVCEGVMQTISKQSLTITNSAFWYSVNSFARRLFVDTQLRSSFVTLCALCKQAWLGIRKAKNGDPIPRDLGSKLVALEALTEFCSSAGEKMKLSKVMGYQIRRIVVPCIMYNVPYSLCDHRIFSKLLKIVTALWKCWRRHVRIEFAILCDQLVFKVLQATVIQIRPIYQMIVIQEVENWFDQPHMLIEMFVNYDMDRKFVSHWNTFSYLIRSMCAIGRRLAVVTGAWDWKPFGVNSQQEDANKIAISIRDVHLQALHEVSRMAKTLMDASGHAFLITQDSDFRTRTLTENAGWVEDEETSRKTDASQSTDASAENSGRKHRPRIGSIRQRRAAHQESEDLIKQAIKIYQDKDSLKKAVEFLLSKGFMPDTPQEIANFLRVYKNSFDPAAIGDFLGEGGKDPIEEDYWSQIRFRYTRAVSFVEMDMESALRLYLTGCGFRLPGEAQKIDRFVDVFVKAFWQDNSGTQYCPFKHPDTIHLLSYAIIMLNTDLHRANLDNNSKNKKMTKDQFIKNLRGVDQGTDVNRDFLSQIYDSVAAQPIELAIKKAPTQEDLKKDGKTPADDMVNVVLSQNNKNSNDIRLAEEKKFILDLGQSLRDSEDLLRSLSPFTYRFHLTNVDTKISLDLVSFMYETVWFHFHAIVEGIFGCKNTDLDIKFAALDVLCYSLTSAIFLNLKMERMAFAILLKTFRKECEDLPHYVSSERTVPDESWYDDVENASATNTMEIIAKLHHLTVHIKDTLQEATNYELTRQIAAKFEKKARILETNTFFIRQGDLSKISRAGKSVTYKFFLFSDHLIYAHVNMKGQFVVHEQLSLSALTVKDVETDPNYATFHISHPIKSFNVVADSPQSKQQWIRDINTAIANCKKRETMQQDGPLNRRMSMITRIEDQQEKLSRENSTTAQPPGNRRRQSYRTHSNATHDSSGAGDEESSFFQAIPFSTPNSPAAPSGKSLERKRSKQGYDARKINTPPPEDEVIEIHVAPSVLSPEEIENVEDDDDENKEESTPASLMTPEERALKQQENIDKFESVLASASEELVNSLFVAVRFVSHTSNF